VTPDGRTLYVVTTKSVVPVTIATNTVGKPIKADHWPEDIVISPNGKKAYVLAQGYKINGVWHGTITPISTRTNKPGRPIPAGHFPVALAISGNGKTLYVADNPASTVTALSTATNKARRSIAVAKRPYSIVSAP
jgi:YVTN family beta-propeller protein